MRMTHLPFGERIEEPQQAAAIRRAIRLIWQTSERSHWLNPAF